MRLNTTFSFYWFGVAMAAGTALFAANLFRTRMGRAFVAVRDQDIAASVIGVNVFRTKLLAFATSSFFVGLAGAMIAYYRTIITWERFTLETSIVYLAMIIVGGLGTIRGSFLGAALITLLPALITNAGTRPAGHRPGSRRPASLCPAGGLRSRDHPLPGLRAQGPVQAVGQREGTTSTFGRSRTEGGDGAGGFRTWAASPLSSNVLDLPFPHDPGTSMTNRTITATLAALLVMPATSDAQSLTDEELDPLVTRVEEGVLERAKLAQVMVDKIFSFSELGQQEIETSAYITGILEENGFAIERAPVGIPTAWFARWGSGRPVISFGSDIDGIPKANQKPGVAYHDPLIPGAPGHGEGHNSGQAVNVVAALALKEVMEAEGIEGHPGALARCRRGAAGLEGMVRARWIPGGHRRHPCSHTSAATCR